jgi:hypothetical protein
MLHDVRGACDGAGGHGSDVGCGEGESGAGGEGFWRRQQGGTRRVRLVRGGGTRRVRLVRGGGRTCARMSRVSRSDLVSISTRSSSSGSSGRAMMSSRRTAVMVRSLKRQRYPDDNTGSSGCTAPQGLEPSFAPATHVESLERFLSVKRFPPRDSFKEVGRGCWPGGCAGCTCATFPSWPEARGCRPPTGRRGTRRVQLVRGEGLGVSDQYEGPGGVGGRGCRPPTGRAQRRGEGSGFFGRFRPPTGGQVVKPNSGAEARDVY